MAFARETAGPIGKAKMIRRRHRARREAERLEIRKLSRLSRSDSLSDRAVWELSKRGFRFAKHWDTYRRYKSAANERRFLRRLVRVAGAKLAVSFFIRSEAKFPISIRKLTPAFEVLPLSPLSSQFLFSRNSYSAQPSGSGSLEGVGKLGRKYVAPEIRVRGTDEIYMLAKASVYGGSGVIVMSETAFWPNYIFESPGDGLYPWDSVLVERLAGEVVLFQRGSGPPQIHVEKAVSLLDSGSHHFGHSAWGLIPRLRALMRAELTGSDIKILVDRRMSPSIATMLEVWGWGDQIVTIESNQQVLVGELYIAPPLKFFPDISPENAPRDEERRALAFPEFDFLFLKGEVKKTPAKRVSLLRHGTGNSRARECLNPEQLETVLSDWGFVNLVSQISEATSLFAELRSAETIVIDDGSISANVLLAGVSNATIIYLTHPGVFNGDHGSWFNQGYLAFQGNRVISIECSVVNENDRTSNWWMDCALLTDELRRALD